MPDIKAVLSEEIRRLARKEIRSAVEPLVKTLQEQKLQIAALRRQMAVLEKMQEKIAAAGGESVDMEADDGAEKQCRLNAAGIVRVRRKLKLTHAEFARLLGVSTQAVSIWEVGKAAPRRETKMAICALRNTGKRELKARLLGISESAAGADENGGK